MRTQPQSVEQMAHSHGAMRIDPKLVLWQNVSALMAHHWGGENLTKLSREAKIGPGTATRIKEMQTSVGLDVVDRVAEVFDLEMWQMLTPGLDPKNPPAAQPVSQAERQLYDRLITSIKELKILP
jgi:hypothetical protein